MVELDDPVDGRLEDQPQMLLGLAEGLVRLAYALQGEIALGEGALLVVQRAPGIGVGLRAADLVRDDASRHADPSTPMMAADLHVEIPRASSRVATVASAAHAETTETLVRIGRARLGALSGASARRGTRPWCRQHGPATMKTMTIPGKSASNDPRVHPQPKTSVAPETAVRTSHCTRCAGEGTHSARTPNAANIVAATMAKVPADSDPVPSAFIGRMSA